MIPAIPKAIRNLKCPDDKRESYFCLSAELHFYVAVSRQGKKSLLYRRKWKGSYKQIDLGKFIDELDDPMSRQMIETARMRCANYETQADPFDQSDRLKQQLTFEELFAEYIERHAMKSRKTTGEMIRNFQRWLLPLAKKRLEDITPDHANQLHSRIAKERGKYSANRSVQLARAVFNKGIDWGRFDGKNPFSKISMYDETPRNRFLTKEEAQRLFKGLDEHAAPDLRDFIKLSLLTGARRSNVMSIRWENVDLVHGTLNIPDTKNKTSQLIPLGAYEIGILKARQREQERASVISEFVFPGRGKSGHLTDLKYTWTILREKLNLTDVTIHDLRRSLAATMASENVNVALIKSAMHHKDLKTTMLVYARTSKQAELEAKQIAHNVWLPPAADIEDEVTSSST